MKKLILLLTALLLCFSFCSCGKDSDKDTEKGHRGVLTEEDGIVSIKESKFPSLIERVELTTENWKDYIKFYSFEEEIVKRDAFGEIVSSETVTRYCLGAGNERYHQFQDTVVELKDKETGELTLFGQWAGNEWYVEEDFNLDNYECTRIKGFLYFVDLPEEALHSPLPGWDYELGFQVVSSGVTTPYSVNPGSKGIEVNGSWDYIFD